MPASLPFYSFDASPGAATTYTVPGSAAFPSRGGLTYAFHGIVAVQWRDDNAYGDFRSYFTLGSMRGERAFMGLCSTEQNSGANNAVQGGWVPTTSALDDAQRMSTVPVGGGILEVDLTNNGRLRFASVGTGGDRFIQDVSIRGWPWLGPQPVV